VTLQRKLFTVDEYEQMVRAGVLGEDDRLELIEGEIVEMSPSGGLHIQVVNRLNRLFSRQLNERAIVSIQNSIRLSNSGTAPTMVCTYCGNTIAVPDALRQPGLVLAAPLFASLLAIFAQR